MSPFDEGYSAASDGLMIESNPHPLNTDEGQAWEDGWWAWFYDEDEE